MTCQECGAGYVAKRSDSRFCSGPCQARNWSHEGEHRAAPPKSEEEKRMARADWQRQYYQENAEALRAYASDRTRQKRVADPHYGRASTHGEPLGPLLEAMSAAQDGLCYLCEMPLDFTVERGVHVDHDHTCCGPRRSCEKCRRGLSHRDCNLAVGWARDDPEKLRRIAGNLEIAITAARARISGAQDAGMLF